eukprot:SAG22_NODE_998_length_6115_cov_2.049701_5_plen_157_part_01
MLLTLVVTALAAQAAPLPLDNDVPGSTAAAAAEQVAHAAQHVRGDATIATTLQSVNVGKPDASKQALAALGFETALDLRVLAGGPKAVELMTTLRTGGELSIADRAKRAARTHPDLPDEPDIVPLVPRQAEFCHDSTRVEPYEVWRHHMVPPGFVTT